jgi:CelD/BcsL family acetyltransferase involved in cellulose biosynthesis
MKHKVELLKPIDLTEDHLAEWRYFQNCNAALASPYFTPEFTFLVSQVRPNVMVAVFEESGRIAGFFPFEQRGRAGRPVGGALSDCQAVIAAPWWDWDPIELIRAVGLSVYDFTHHRAEQNLLGAFHRSVHTSHTIDLTRGFDAYVRECRDRWQHAPSSTSGLPHQTMARCQRLERRIGPLRFEMHDPNPQSLRQLIAWKRQQFCKTGAADVFARRWTNVLLERIYATQGGTFAGVLSTLSVDNKIIAAHMGMRSTSVLHWWFPAYDVTQAKFSPGLVLLLEICRRAEEFGIRTVELGYGDEPYKLLVANSGIPVAAGFIGQPSLETRYRRFVRFLHGSLDRISLLPAGAVALWTGKLIRRHLRRAFQSLGTIIRIN